MSNDIRVPPLCLLSGTIFFLSFFPAPARTSFNIYLATAFLNFFCPSKMGHHHFPHSIAPLTPTPISNIPAAARPVPQAPAVSPSRPAGALLAELVTYNGSPFKDHWAYFIQSSTDPNIGVYISAEGDVRSGFTLEIRRNYDLSAARPTKRIPLQWIDARHVSEKDMCNNGVQKSDTVPVCLFEQSALKVKAPEKSLNSADDAVSAQFTIARVDTVIEGLELHCCG